MWYTSLLEKRREEEKVHQFLMGLDDINYGTVRSNILAADHLPSMNRVYSTLVQEERMKNVTRAKEERGEVMGLGFKQAPERRDVEKQRTDQWYVLIVARQVMMLEAVSN
ncbi:hypothetical protein MRB53_016464 [Persea americana]|uniref:Uncharacterized protein n=1 Tax=Persea americana TaxID=3435 RepID=A0ACC2M2A0_PERAE|nr:hypothetical protein MRB53_016464 [Persea americana]